MEVNHTPLKLYFEETALYNENKFEAEKMDLTESQD